MSTTSSIIEHWLQNSEVYMTVADVLKCVFIAHIISKHEQMVLQSGFTKFNIGFFIYFLSSNLRKEIYIWPSLWLHFCIIYEEFWKVLDLSQKEFQSKFWCLVIYFSKWLRPEFFTNLIYKTNEFQKIQRWVWIPLTHFMIVNLLTFMKF